jgi:hypothetical protein
MRHRPIAAPRAFDCCNFIHLMRGRACCCLSGKSSLPATARAARRRRGR